MTESSFSSVVHLVVRYLPSMRDYHAFACACKLFSCAARKHREEAQLHLARAVVVPLWGGAHLTYHVLANGLKHGLYRCRDDEGILLFSAHYRRGELHGPYFVRETADTNMTETGEFRDGKREGRMDSVTCEGFTPIKEAIEHYRRGRLHGPCSIKATVLITANYYKGHLRGPFTVTGGEGREVVAYYGETGAPQFYQNSEITSVTFSQTEQGVRTYDPDSGIHTLTTYQRGRKAGPFKCWNQAYMLIEDASYRNGRLRGHHFINRKDNGWVLLSYCFETFGIMRGSDITEEKPSCAVAFCMPNDAAQQTSRYRVTEDTLPLELWYDIAALLPTMRDLNAFARACPLFARVARDPYFSAAAKNRLARRRNCKCGVCYLDWGELANGHLHGPYSARLNAGPYTLAGLSQEELDGLYVIVFACHFRDGRLDGEYEMFDLTDAGKRYRLRRHYQQGKQHGMCLRYEEGKLVEGSEWQEGQLLRRTSYTPLGISTERYQYCGGQLHGKVETYDCLLGRRELTHYHHGKRHGACTSWYATRSHSSLQEECFYCHGKRYGYHRGWHSNGRLQFEYFCVADQCEGEGYEWHASGTLAVQAHFLRGKLHGTMTKWHEGAEQRLLSRGDYKHGKKKGEHYTWSNEPVPRLLSYRLY